MPSFTAAYAGRPVKSTLVSLTMPLTTFLGIADQPGRLDGYGPVTAALARRIAADAAKDQPEYTAWRCVVVDDVHGTVLGTTDPVWTPRHDPPPRLARLVTAMEPVCVFPGCRLPARRCDLDHRIPYDPADPDGTRGGGRTCSCNLAALCRTHHQQKTAGALKVRAITRDDDPTAPAGTLEWTLPSGFTSRTHPHVAQTTLIPSTGPVHDRDTDGAEENQDDVEDVPDTDWADRAWQHSRERAAQAHAEQHTREAQQAEAAAHHTWLDDHPPF